jgi:crotonobetainyl-CoA:carnitine CoA-transferase CaiB-like acyl-CoA transferase
MVEMAQQVLEDILVLDMTRLVSGPFCTMILGDLGADVIKIERIGTEVADDRLNIPFPLPPGISMDTLRAYNPLDRNKRSICIDLKLAEGRKVFHELAEKSDVLIEAFRPGVTARLEADYESLNKLNPRLIYCSLTGYGQTGPYSHLPGHDINFISVAGALGLIGKDGVPVIPLNLLGDYCGGGLMAVIGILSALLARKDTERGQLVDIAMCDGVASLLSAYICGHLLTDTIPKPGGVNRYTEDPFYQAYETKDGKFISLGCREAKFVQNLCRAVGREDLATAQESGEQKGEEAFTYLREVFLSRTRDEWFNLLSQEEVSVSKANSLDEVLIDPQLLHRDMVVELDHPRAGKVKQIGIPVKLSQTPGSVRKLGPSPGEHTDEILSGLGYTEKSIRVLRETGAIG